MYSSILAWRIPWTERPEGLQSTSTEFQRATKLRLKLFSRHTLLLWENRSMGKQIQKQEMMTSDPRAK